MSFSQIKSISRQIEDMGGTWTGHPASLEQRFKCEISWVAFTAGFNGEIRYAPHGRVTIALPGVEIHEIKQDDELWSPDPELWSEYAAQFLLGENQGIAPYSDQYASHRDVIDPLADAVDFSIAAHYFPSVTPKGKAIHVYSIHETGRSILYAGEGETFKLYGNSVLNAA